MTSIPVRRDGTTPGAAAGQTAARMSGNIVLFSRPSRGSETPPLVVRAGDRPAPWRPPNHGRGLMPLFVICALALHAGLYALERKPVPLASVGEVSVAVEILLGSQVAPGLASTPSPAVAARPEPQDPDQPTKAEAADPIIDEAQAPPQSQSAAPVSARSEATAEPEPLIHEAIVAPSPTASTGRKPPLVQHQRPAMERKPSVVDHKPSPQTRDKPTTRQVRLHSAEPGHTAQASTPSTPSSGVGRGRSDAESNYPGRVYAHLARYQRAPPDGGGNRGVARVAISIDGSGRVLGVRLTQSSGNAGFDQEAQALVRRASPLPPPPGGRPLALGWSVALR